MVSSFFSPQTMQGDTFPSSGSLTPTRVESTDDDTEEDEDVPQDDDDDDEEEAQCHEDGGDPVRGQSIPTNQGLGAQPTRRVTLKPRRRTQSQSCNGGYSSMGTNQHAATAFDNQDKDADDGLSHSLPAVTDADGGDDADGAADASKRKTGSVKRPLEQPCQEIKYNDIAYKKIQYSPIPRKRIAYHPILLHDIEYSGDSYFRYPRDKSLQPKRKLSRSQSFAWGDAKDKPDLYDWPDKYRSENYIAHQDNFCY